MKCVPCLSKQHGCGLTYIWVELKAYGTQAADRSLWIANSNPQNSSINGSSYSWYKCNLISRTFEW